jgi:hypothetical protein
MSVSGTTITLAVSEPTYCGTHHKYIHAVHSTYPDSSTPSPYLDIYIYVTITPICQVSYIIQPTVISNQWIWQMEDVDWWITAYTH